jgi:predicted butyrate kinase (DUF1464 family)
MKTCSGGKLQVLKLPLTGEWPKFEQQLFLMEIGKRFGSSVSFSNGAIGFSMGHSFEDDIVEAEQDGRSVKLRCVILESMVSNLYKSWFWDGGQRRVRGLQSPKLSRFGKKVLPVYSSLRAILDSSFSRFVGFSSSTRSIVC